MNNSTAIFINVSTPPEELAFLLFPTINSARDDESHMSLTSIEAKINGRQNPTSGAHTELLSIPALFPFPL